MKGNARKEKTVSDRIQENSIKIQLINLIKDLRLKLYPQHGLLWTEIAIHTLLWAKIAVYTLLWTKIVIHTTLCVNSGCRAQ